MPESFARLALTAEPPPPRPAPMTKVTWHAIDLRTGRRGAPVVARPGVTFSRILSEATETTIEVQIPDDPNIFPDWEAAVEPAQSIMLAVDQNDNPIWGGLVYRQVSTSSAWVSLSLVTLEAYLDRRYINADVSFANADQVSVIAKQVIETTLSYGINFTIDAPYSNWLRDREYLVDDDKTVLSILQELSEVENGIEFTVDLEWVDETNAVLDRIIRIRNRVGTVYLGTTGVQTDHPPAVFHMPGSVIDFEYIKDYSTDNGANAVVAVSSGEGDTRPESKRHIAVPIVIGWGGQMAMFEKRFTPSTSITSTDTLDAHAYRELLETWDGLIELTLTANLDTAPQVGVDFWLGDDVGVSLTGRRFPERISSDGGRVPGYLATLRCIGWEIDLGARVLKPRLVELNEVEVETL